MADPVDSPESLLRRGIRLPPQPQVLVDVLQQAERGQPDVRGLARLIVRDPGLTAALYRGARSPLYARRTPPQSVDQVVLLLGTQVSLALLQASCLRDAIAGDPAVMTCFWARSRAIADIAALVATRLPGRRTVAPEQAYLAGIFHDCGVPVLMQRFPEYCRTLGLDGLAQKWADVAAEDGAFAADHAVVGYLIARHWRLPVFVADAIRLHHDPLGDVPRGCRLLVAILQCAIELYERDCRLEPTNGGWDEAAVRSEFGMSAEVFPEWRDELMDRFHAAGGASS